MGCVGSSAAIGQDPNPSANSQPGNAGAGKAKPGTHPAASTSSGAQTETLTTTAAAPAPAPAPVPWSRRPKRKNIITASKDGDIDAVKTLLEADPPIDINYLGSWDNTPLIYACQYQHTDLALFLMSAGADVTIINERGNTALLHAAVEGLTAAVSELLARGADPSPKPSVVYNGALDRNQTLTPMLAASVNGHVAVLKLLADKGVDVGQSVASLDPEGGGGGGAGGSAGGSSPPWRFMTPLMMAAHVGHVAVVEELIRLGAAPAARTPSGATALSLATDAEHQEVVTLLQPVTPDPKEAFGESKSSPVPSQPSASAPAPASGSASGSASAPAPAAAPSPAPAPAPAATSTPVRTGTVPPLGPLPSISSDSNNRGKIALPPLQTPPSSMFGRPLPGIGGTAAAAAAAASASPDELVSSIMQSAGPRSPLAPPAKELAVTPSPMTATPSKVGVATVGLSVARAAARLGNARKSTRISGLSNPRRTTPRGLEPPPPRKATLMRNRPLA